MGSVAELGGGRSSHQFLHSFLSFANYEDVLTKEDEEKHGVTHVDDEYEDDTESELRSTRAIGGAHSSSSSGKVLQDKVPSSLFRKRSKKMTKQSSMSLLYRRRSLNNDGRRRSSAAARMSKVGSMGLLSSPGAAAANANRSTLAARKSLVSGAGAQELASGSGQLVLVSSPRVAELNSHPGKQQSKIFQTLLSNYGGSSKSYVCE